MRCITLLVPALMAFALPAHAAVVFSDGFEGESAVSVLNFNSFDNWTVSNGTVDLIKTGDYSINCRTGNLCVDLDGSTKNAGILALTTPIAYGMGDLVSGEAYLSGNQRNAATEFVDIVVRLQPGAKVGAFTFIVPGQPDILFGDYDGETLFVWESTILASDVFRRFGFSFTAGNAGALSLEFRSAGGDNIGAILDDVSISVTSPTGAVPEPATWAMLIAGFGLVGFTARRRRGAAASA